MEIWQYLLAPALALALLLAARSALRRRRARQERDFTRRLETVLKPRERIRVICPNRGGRWVLTSSRLLRETGEGFLAIPFSRIRQVTGRDAGGKATSAVSKMASLTVKADQEHHIYNTCDAFPALARELKAKTKRRKTTK